MAYPQKSSDAAHRRHTAKTFVILTEILAAGKHEIGSVIRFLGCLSQSLEKRPQRRVTTVAAVYAQTPPLLPLVDACTVVTLGP